MKTTPSLVIGYVLFMAGIFAMTAISYFWPDRPNWVSWAATLVMVAFSFVLVYVLSRDRKANHG